MVLMTQADYARHRGVKPSSVALARKARIKAAEVKRGSQTLIDIDLADKLWAINTRDRPNPEIKKAPLRFGSWVETPSLDRPPSVQALQTWIKGLPEDEIPQDVNESIRRKEHYNAERQRIAALKDREEVGSIAEMRTATFNLAKAAREAVLAVPSRISAELAATLDPFAVEQLLERELITAMRTLESFSG